MISPYHLVYLEGKMTQIAVHASSWEITKLIVFFKIPDNLSSPTSAPMCYIHLLVATMCEQPTKFIVVSKCLNQLFLFYFLFFFFLLDFFFNFLDFVFSKYYLVFFF